MTAHVLKMIGYIEKLIQLDFVMDHGLNVDMILQSPLNAYSYVMLAYHLTKLKSTLSELLNILEDAETNIKNDKGQILIVSSSSSRPKTRWSKSNSKKNK